MARPAAMASKALRGEVWRSVMAVRRNGTATTVARAQRLRHARLRHEPGHLDARRRARGDRTSARTRADVRLALDPAQDHEPRRAARCAKASTSTSTPFQG